MTHDVSHLADAMMHTEWIKGLRDGEPCDHAGCLSHVSHPCEGCGRIAGRRRRRLKVISLHQPWALLWVTGSKIHETRGWALHPDVVGTTIAVHAAKKWDKHVAAMAHREPFFSCLRTPSPLVSENLHFGAIIGTVDIVRCVRAEPLVDQLSAQELAFGNFSDPDEDRWAWEATNPVLFDRPIPTKGQQGFWMVDLP